MLGKEDQLLRFKRIHPCSAPFFNVIIISICIFLDPHTDTLTQTWLTLLLLIAAPFEKSLQIILVRDVDGKTFWDALNDAISPRIKSPTPVDDSALSTFRSTFEGQPLKKGTFIFLTWPLPSKMLVSLNLEVNYIFLCMSTNVGLWEFYFSWLFS